MSLISGQTGRGTRSVLLLSLNNHAGIEELVGWLVGLFFSESLEDFFAL